MVDVKVPVMLFAGTVTLAGTESADVSVDESETTPPPGGGGVFNVTVAVTLCPPRSHAPNWIWIGGQALTVIVVLTDVPAYLAVSVAVLAIGVGGNV